MATTTREDDNQLLTALRHPLRRQILRTMADEEAISPRQISNELDEPLSNVSYHVRVLADCGAVTLVDTAPVRGSMQHFYSHTIEEPWALAVLGLGDNASDGRQSTEGEDDHPEAETAGGATP